MSNTSHNGFDVQVRQYSDATFRLSIGRPGASADSSLNRYGFIDSLPEKEYSEPALEVLQSDDGFSITLRRAGEVLLTGSAHFDEQRQAWKASFALQGSENLFGLGDQTRERVDHRGTRADMWIKNVECYIPIPFLMSSRGYGVLCNTTRRHQWDIGATDENVWSLFLAQENIDLYFFVGDSMKEVLGAYTDLTGKPALPPKWSFGLWYLCHEKVDVFETMRTASAFREREIPCDVIALEPGWMEKYYDFSTDKKWHPDRFPVVSHLNAYNFTDALRNMGFRLGLWLCNDYDLSYEAERQVQQSAVVQQEDGGGFAESDVVQDLHFQTPVRLDTLTKPEEPWFEHLKKFIDQGVSFFKQDGANQTLEHPDRVWGNGMLDAEMHNLYPLLYSKQMYEGFKQHTGLRYCGFTPNGYVGLQRYTGTWTGDTGGGKSTLVACMNLALSGHSMVTCDMRVIDKSGIHFGFLLPWAQVNSFAYFEQPWYLGEELQEVFTDYARLRSRLVPYIYSAAYDAHTTGVPMLRPLMLEFPDDQAAVKVLRQFMLGDNLMVTAFTEEVYFPAGKWFDFWTGEAFGGSQTLSYTVPGKRGGGLFVRGNSILPLGPTKQHVQQLVTEGYTLHIYLDTGQSTTAEIFDDDGVSFEYQNGNFTLHEWKAEYSGSVLSLEVPQTVKTDRIIAALDCKPEHVLVNNAPVKFAWDQERCVVNAELISE